MKKQLCISEELLFSFTNFSSCLSVVMKRTYLVDKRTNQQSTKVIYSKNYKEKVEESTAKEKRTKKETVESATAKEKRTRKMTKKDTDGKQSKYK